MSPKSILIISSYTILKLVHFFETQTHTVYFHQFRIEGSKELTKLVCKAVTFYTLDCRIKVELHLGLTYVVVL